MYYRRLVCRHVNGSSMAPSPGGHHSIATFKLRNGGPTAQMELILQGSASLSVWEVTWVISWTWTRMTRNCFDSCSQGSNKFGTGTSSSRRLAMIEVRSSKFPSRLWRNVDHSRTSCSFCSSKAFRNPSCALSDRRECLRSKVLIMPWCTFMLIPISSGVSSRISNCGVCDHIHSSVCDC
jgi:hypothetical protein